VAKEGGFVPARPTAGRPLTHPSAVDGDDVRYALLIHCDEETAVGDRERERREEQFTTILERPRARGVIADARWLLPIRAEVRPAAETLT
jgi:hypothetical protein